MKSVKIEIVVVKTIVVKYSFTRFIFYLFMPMRVTVRMRIIPGVSPKSNILYNIPKHHKDNYRNYEFLKHKKSRIQI